MIGGKNMILFFTVYSGCDGIICSFNKHKRTESSTRIIGMVVHYMCFCNYDYLGN